MMYMFAMEWSNPMVVKPMIGNQMASILETTSEEPVAMNMAKHTNQFAPIARRNTAPSELDSFFLATEKAYALSLEPVHVSPKYATKKAIVRAPMKLNVQCSAHICSK